MAAQDFFIWGAGGSKKTPEQIAREREIADTILQRAGDTSPVGHWTQGAARVLDALGGVVRQRRADAGEREIADVNQRIASPIIQAILGGGSSASSPASSSAIPMSGAAGEIAATAPGSAITPSGILPSSFLSAVDSSEGGGAYDTLYGNAQRDKFAGTDVSSMPIRDVIAFTDPSGAYAQAVKSQIGRVATPVGRHQIVGTTLRNAVSDLGLDPNAPFNAATQDRIALHLAKKRLASADTIGGKIAALRSEWHGFRNVPDEQMRQIVADIEQAPVNVASVAPQTATDAIEAISPLQPSPEAAMSYAGQERAAPVSLSEEVAAYQQTPEYASVFPGRQQPAAEQPVQVAGGGDRVPMASSSTGINPAIIEALTNPQATPATQRLAGILLEQEQARQNAAVNEQNWRARQAYEQELLAQDPLRMAQIEKLKRENAQPPGSDETFYGNPVAVQNADGSVSYGQIGNRGTFRPIQLGEGQTFAPPTKTVNTGTEIIQQDQAGNIISRTPIENEAAAAARARGSTIGQTGAEREISAPAEIQSGQNALELVDGLINDPNREWGTGMSSVFNIIPGTPGYDFQNKVNQATSGAFLTAIEQMRGLGALSNAEGQTATRAVTRMETATSEGAFLEAAEDYKKIVRQGIERAQGRLRGNAAPTGNKTSTGVQWSVE